MIYWANLLTDDKAHAFPFGGGESLCGDYDPAVVAEQIDPRTFRFDLHGVPSNSCYICGHAARYVRPPSG